MRPQAAGEPQPGHPEVADEGPERMAERFRPVALEPEMGGPGEPIPDDRGGDEKAPVESEDGEHEAGTGEQAAAVVQQPGLRLGVRPQVAEPELVVRHAWNPKPLGDPLPQSA